MHPGVIVVQDRKRGCGWRRGGGFYLRSDNPAAQCSLLPIEIDKPCPHCGMGIRITRVLQRVLSTALLSQEEKDNCPGEHCSRCITMREAEWWLLAVGASHYPTTERFCSEWLEMGLSKRIPRTPAGLPALPRGFKVGESIVALAHPRAITTYVKTEAGPLEPKYEAGIFAITKPSRIEYVVTEEESDEYIEKLLEHGITPVKIEKVDQHGQPVDLKQAEMEIEDAEEEVPA